MIFNKIEKFPAQKKNKCQKLNFLRVEAKSVGKLGLFGKEKTFP
jgi:hypothetical protein